MGQSIHQSLSTKSYQPNLSLSGVTTLMLLQHDPATYKVYGVHSVMEFYEKRWKIICVLNYFTISCWATFTAILGYRQPVVDHAYNHTKRNSSLILLPLSQVCATMSIYVMLGMEPRQGPYPLSPAPLLFYQYACLMPLNHTLGN